MPDYMKIKKKVLISKAMKKMGKGLSSTRGGK